MRLRRKLTSVLAVVMISLITISLPAFAKVPKQPTGIPIPQYSTIPEVQYIPEPPQEIVTDTGIVIPQWNSGLHTNIVIQGIAKLKRDKPLLASRLTTQINLGGGLYTTPEKLLIGGVNWPDSYEVDDYYSTHAYMGHFWDPGNNTNYTGVTNPTAYTRFNNHYFNATAASSATTAWNELSYSLHYLGDLNAPHHAANVPYALTGDYTHTNFEAFADQNYSNFTTSWTGDYFVANSTIQAIATYYATNAKAQINNAKSGSDDSKRIAVENTLPYAQSGAAGMIYRFLITTNW